MAEGARKETVGLVGNPGPQARLLFTPSTKRASVGDIARPVLLECMQQYFGQFHAILPAAARRRRRREILPTDSVDKPVDFWLIETCQLRRNPAIDGCDHKLGSSKGCVPNAGHAAGSVASSAWPRKESAAVLGGLPRSPTMAACRRSAVRDTSTLRRRPFWRVDSRDVRIFLQELRR